MSNWQKKLLGEFIELKRGYDLPAKDRQPGPYPLITSSGPDELISQPKVKGPGVVTGRYGTVGQIFFVSDDFWPLNTTLYVKDFRGNHPRFVYYFLHCINWEKFNDKSGVPGINRNDVHREPVLVPPLKQQEKIATVLQYLDDKIELNRQMNETLEAMAQAIFRDWFVDFGPVRRKLAGITDPVAIMGGLTPDPARAAELAALFPDRFGEDELPEGWLNGTLSDWAEVNPESWSTRNHPEWVNYVDLSNTKWGTIEAAEKLPWANAPSRARRVIRPFDTIVATTRPGNGSYAYISQNGYTASTGFAVMRPKQPQFSQFVYCAATDPLNIARLAQLADGHGGTYPAVNPGEVGASPIVNCGTKVVEAFEALVQPLRTKIEHCKVENRTLAETRDYLLPRLMSGEVRVGDVAQELAA